MNKNFKLDICYICNEEIEPLDLYTYNIARQKYRHSNCRWVPQTNKCYICNKEINAHDIVAFEADQKKPYKYRHFECVMNKWDKGEKLESEKKS